MNFEGAPQHESELPNDIYQKLNDAESKAGGEIDDLKEAQEILDDIDSYFEQSGQDPNVAFDEVTARRYHQLIEELRHDDQPDTNDELLEEDDAA